MMPNLLYIKAFATLAQIAAPWDEASPNAPASQPTPSQRMSFSDLQQGLRSVNNGQTNDNAFRNSVLGLMVVVAVIALFIHLRQRAKNRPTLDSLPALSRELSRVIRFPFGTRMLLRWVARHNKVPFPALLLSSALFDQAIQNWAAAPAFSAARVWGQKRLDCLRPVLFNAQQSNG